jgi:formate/nitrite transporter FocA (FNT family)
MQQRGLDKKERDEVDDLRQARAPVQYEVIRQEGEAELERPAASLWWSGVAAGLAISASIFCQGYLHSHLPNAEWRPLVTNFGYCIGFLVVIIGGFQLFTEQTVKAILPLLSEQSRQNFTRTARLWCIVLLANMAGTFLAALFATYTGAVKPEQFSAFLEISRPLAALGFFEAMMRGIPAGFLIAALAWIMPNAEGSKFWVIIALTYAIALGEFAHVVAGAAEIFLLLIGGEISVAKASGGLLLPILIGNVLGGTALFSLIAYAQVKEEM